MVDVTLADSVAEYSKYGGWPELKESFMTGTVRAAYLLAPMVMDLVESGVPAKIVSLGHRSGAVIMVRTDSAVRTIGDLRGRRIAMAQRSRGHPAGADSTPPQRTTPEATYPTSVSRAIWR